MKLCRIVIIAAVGLGLLIGYSSLTYLYAQENKLDKTETSPMSQLDILQLENFQLKMELLKKDMQILADAICTNAEFSRESCRINLAAGLVTGSKKLVENREVRDEKKAVDSSNSGSTK